MASKRMLSKTISTSEKLADCSLETALLFTWLIPHCDDWGRMVGNPRKVKAIVVPMRDDFDLEAVARCLRELSHRKLIFWWNPEGKKVLEVVDWFNHQTITENKRTQSKFPAYDGSPQESPRIPKNPQPNLTELNLTKLKRPLSGKPDYASVVKEIIEYLNEKAGRSFTTCKANAALITARLAEGRTVEQFQAVIDTKVAGWKEDPEMARYLRPETLFTAKHFESYLNEPDIGERQRTFILDGKPATKEQITRLAEAGKARCVGGDKWTSRA